jgi:hypothetical protein
MSLLGRLATSLGRNDEQPNQELASQIAEERDGNAVKELVANLGNKDTGVQSDCIKVLYEIGSLRPSLIAPYAKEFIRLLDNGNNRLAWGAMTALDSIALESPQFVYSNIPKIIQAAAGGSVITRDHAVGILIKLASIGDYSEKASELLMKQLESCPANQLPMYAENALPIINDRNRAAFVKTLTSRLGGIEKESKRKRVAKVIAKTAGRARSSRT